MAKPQKIQHVIGIPSYKRENWDALMEIFEDRHKLPDTFDQWVDTAQSLVNRLEARGIQVIKVDIDPVEFPIWCGERSLHIDADARNTRANEAA